MSISSGHRQPTQPANMVNLLKELLSLSSRIAGGQPPRQLCAEPCLVIKGK